MLHRLSYKEKFCLRFKRLNVNSFYEIEAHGKSLSDVHKILVKSQTPVQ